MALLCCRKVFEDKIQQHCLHRKTLSRNCMWSVTFLEHIFLFSYNPYMYTLARCKVRKKMYNVRLENAF